MVAGRVKYSGPGIPRTKRLTPKFQTHQVALPPELAGRRLDQVLAQLLPQYSRTRIQRWIEEGAVRVNGLAGRARDVVVGGETATVEARLPPETGVAAEKLPIDIVHEDAAVLVLNKAARCGRASGRGQSRAHAAERAAGARCEAQARAARRTGPPDRQGHQRVVSRGAHARGAHGAGRGAGRARSRTRVPRAVHRRHDRRRHRG